MTAIAIAITNMGCAGPRDSATITVPPGRSIQSSIDAASPGDTVVVLAGTRNESIVLNKSVTVKAESVGAVMLRPGGYRGIDIQCSNCTVEGFVLENFGQAAATDTKAPRANVVLRDLAFRNVGAGIWVSGTGWTVERVTINPFHARDGEDYMNAFGSGHTFRRLFFAGLHPEDLRKPNGSYKHNNGIQTWTIGGTAGLKDTLIEECIFTDFEEGIFLHNQSGIDNAINNITVRNCVFWGVDFPRSGATWPSHGSRYTGPSTGPLTLQNNLYRRITLNVRLTNLTTPVTVQNNIFVDSGTPYALNNTASKIVDRGEAGNLLWNSNKPEDMPLDPDKTTIDPQLQNPKAETPAELLGPDGIPWTADDAWRPMNPEAKGYGPACEDC